MVRKSATVKPVITPGLISEINGTFVIKLSGDFLPIQWKHQGKTALSEQKLCFPSEFHITQKRNHWANEMIFWISFSPHILKREEKKWILIKYHGRWFQMFSKFNRQTNSSHKMQFQALWLHQIQSWFSQKWMEDIWYNREPWKRNKAQSAPVLYSN